MMESLIRLAWILQKKKYILAGKGPIVECIEKEDKESVGRLRRISKSGRVGEPFPTKITGTFSEVKEGRGEPCWIRERPPADL